MSETLEVFRPGFALENGVRFAAEHGYYFAEGALTNETNNLLAKEINRLPLELGDHTSKPINQQKTYEVKQEHERFYAAYGSAETPTANLVVAGLASLVRSLKAFPTLKEWLPNEIGYQRYSFAGYIGIHKDRASDKLLSVTFTLAGSAPVEIYKTLDDPKDYSPDNVELVDSFETSPGSVMLLRAPGLSNGEQVPHKVLNPTVYPRNILNLRMRPTILEQPSHSRWTSQ